MSPASAATPAVDATLANRRLRHRRLRICHLAYTFYENDNRVIRYAEALAERRDDVDVIALRREKQSWRGRINGVEVYRIQRRTVNERGRLSYLFKLLWFTIQSAFLLATLQLRRRYDVVHVHNVPDFLVFAAVVPKLMGARVILDIHDVLPELYAGKFGADDRSAVFCWLLRIERISCRFADHVIVANHLWHAKLTSRALPASQCTPIMNYPDLRLFKPLTGDRRRTDGRFVFLYPGTLNHHQGLDLAIKAFALAKDRMPEAELHIYGEGPARQGLVRLTQELGLVDRVKILDRLPITDIAVVMASADVGVEPKLGDGFGNEAFSTKTLEFMACNVPVIVSRTRVHAHYLNDTIVRFFTPGQETELAHVMLDVYAHRGDHAERIRAARAFASLYGWHERASSYTGVVDSLASLVRRPVLARP
jgi:glycosyltransferase involved in cell wall biosynthesis